MAKRIYYESAKKWAIRVGIPAVTSIFLIFMYINSLGVVTVNGYSKNMICAGTLEDPCYAFMNLTFKEDVFIYPVDSPDPWGRDTPFSFDPNVKSWKLERSWGSGWRTINLSKTCQYTWCGAPHNGMTDNKYSIAFRKGRTYQIRITGYKNSPYESIKWGAFNGKIDPTWHGTMDLKSTKEKLQDKDYRNYLRTKDSIKTLNGITKIYNASEKRLKIEDSNKILIDFKLTTPYYFSVGASNDTKVAELFLYDWKNGTELFDKLDSYNIKRGYNKQTKTFTYKYGEDYIEEECHTLNEFDPKFPNATFCENVTKTNWTTFNLLSELPHKNIKIGIFTKTKIGEKVEWVPIIHGFECLEWAEWDVRSGEKLEFDTINGYDSAIVQVDSTHYLVTYGETDSSSSGNGYAVILEVNQTDWTITNKTKFEFDTTWRIRNSLVKIDDTRYLNAYADSNVDAHVVVLKVNLTDWTITAGTPLMYDGNGYGQYCSMVKIDNTHFINLYKGYYTSAVVFTVDDMSVTKNDITSFGIESGYGNYYSLQQVDSTHYLGVYDDHYTDGYSLILTVNTTDWTITAGTKHVFDSTSGLYNSLQQVDSTHYINAYAGSGTDGYAVILTVNTADWTISSGTKHEFDTTQGQWNSLIKIDSTHYIDAYQGADYDGYAVILTVNTADWTISSGTKHEFDTVNAYYNSLAQVDSTHYINAYAGSGTDGYAVILNVELAGAPSVVLNSPEDNFKTTSASLTFNGTATDDINLTSVALYHNCGQEWGVANITENPTNNTPVIFEQTLPDCNAVWNYYACDNESNCAFGTDRSFIIDTTPPTYSNNQTNNTQAGQSTLFSILYDDTALNPNGQWIFSTNNTGTWTNDSAVNFTATPQWANVTKTLNSTSGLIIGYRWYAKDNAGNSNNTGIYTLTTTSSGSPDLNFSIWTGSSWTDAYSEYLEFRCSATQTECEPTNQDVSSSQSIYQICNNGTADGSYVNMAMSQTCSNINLLCDDDYTYAGAITLSTSEQQIHGALAVDACIPISCWADYSNPTQGCYFDTNATIG